MNPTQDSAFAGMKRVELSYMEKFHVILSASDAQFDVNEVLARFPNVGINTVKKYLRTYLDRRPLQIPRIIGFYPAAETVIRLAEEIHGLVSSQNLSAINLSCKKTIDTITKPKHSRFLEGLLAGHIDADSGIVSVARGTLTDLLYEEYVDFVHESDNGLVSIAGSMNEKILIRGLANAGLELGVDFRKTGTDSEGDLQIEHRGSRTTRIMYCEVKSYAARERLLRGLQDIPHPEKVGVGFFNNAAEFNPDRTKTLLAANPLAIYMPDETHARLAEGSLSQTTRNQDRLYRPLSLFIGDMQHFKTTGNLPRYI